MRTVHLAISGRVQGVGYRAWFEATALQLGLDGWVRNRRDGSVEAVIGGGEAAVTAMIAACHKGPGAARVSGVAVTDNTAPVTPGFQVLPSA